MALANYYWISMFIEFYSILVWFNWQYQCDIIHILAPPIFIISNYLCMIYIHIQLCILYPATSIRLFFFQKKKPTFEKRPHIEMIKVNDRTGLFCIFIIYFILFLWSNLLVYTVNGVCVIRSIPL